MTIRPIDHGALVAAPLHQLAGGQGEDEVRGEEGELDEHGLRSS